MSLLLVALLPLSLGCLNHYIDSTTKDTIDAAAAAASTTTEEDSSDSDSTTTTSSIEAKDVHYVDTEHYTVTTDLEVWNYRR